MHALIYPGTRETSKAPGLREGGEEEEGCGCKDEEREGREKEQSKSRFRCQRYFIQSTYNELNRVTGSQVAERLFVVINNCSTGLIRVKKHSIEFVIANALAFTHWQRCLMRKERERERERERGSRQVE